MSDLLMCFSTIKDLLLMFYCFWIRPNICFNISCNLSIQWKLKSLNLNYISIIFTLTPKNNDSSLRVEVFKNIGQLL